MSNLEEKLPNVQPPLDFGLLSDSVTKTDSHTPFINLHSTTAFWHPSTVVYFFKKESHLNII